jgi:hypothetical protein
LSATGGYTDAMAVSAVTAWINWHGDKNLVPLALVSGDPAELYASLTVDVPIDGTYTIMLESVSAATSSNGVVKNDIFLDTVNKGSIIFDFGLPDAPQVFGAPVFEQLSAGQHVIELYVSQPASPGVVTVYESYLQAWRVV